MRKTRDCRTSFAVSRLVWFAIVIKPSTISQNGTPTMPLIQRRGNGVRAGLQDVNTITYTPINLGLRRFLSTFLPVPLVFTDHLPFFLPDVFSGEPWFEILTIISVSSSVATTLKSPRTTIIAATSLPTITRNTKGSAKHFPRNRTQPRLTTIAYTTLTTLLQAVKGLVEEHCLARYWSTTGRQPQIHIPVGAPTERKPCPHISA